MIIENRFLSTLPKDHVVQRAQRIMKRLGLTATTSKSTITGTKRGHRETRNCTRLPHIIIVSLEAEYLETAISLNLKRKMIPLDRHYITFLSQTLQNALLNDDNRVTGLNDYQEKGLTLQRGYLFYATMMAIGINILIIAFSYLIADLLK